MRKLTCSVFLTALLLVISANKTNALNYYWIGGTGNWDDLNHWATTSGGTTLHNYIPTAVDDVFFDSHSFNAAGQTVTLNPLTILCNNMDWTGVTGMPSLAALSNNRYGSLIYQQDNYQNNWNGTFKSAPCPDGTYYYIIKATYLSKPESLIRGNITILR